MDSANDGPDEGVGGDPDASGAQAPDDAGTPAQPPPGAVVASDAQAISLAYVQDAAQADPARFRGHTTDERCATCAVFHGRPGDSWGGCPLFGTKQVSAAGWCSAFAKRS